MTPTTQAIKKGLLPRIHQPKSTKTHGKKTTSKSKTRKRVASDSEESGDDNKKSSSPALEPTVKKRLPKRRWQAKESEEEVEVIEDDVEPPENSVEDVNTELDVDVLQEVSPNIY